MDFFNSKSTTSSSTNPSDGLATPFMQALNERFATGAPPSLLTSAFTPAMPLQTPMLPATALSARAHLRPPVPRLAAVPQGAVAGPSTPSLVALKQGGGSASAPITAFAALLPEQVVSLTNLRDVLVIDIRPHAQFQTSRCSGAISLVVPSTLLKRPAFPLEKMAEMIEDKPARSRFEMWRSMKKLVIYDVDTSYLTDITNLAGLLRKFQAAGYQGELLWVKGGFNALLRTSPSAIDTAVLEMWQEDHLEDRKDIPLRARNLSTHAFQQSSTTLVGQRTPKGSDHIRTASSASVAANPFYDNIRQNRELAQGVDTRIPLTLPREILARKNELPFKWLQDIVERSVKDEAGDQLAMQFYRIELGEQRRLQGVMEHHSTESGHKAHSGSSSEGDEYPYSITAGIEMGSKNRYRNIWPFEHARVRLPKTKGGSDYFNASFVQSLVSNRRYIATQGPLDSTYDDFWAVCWAQNVPVIVMLTREIESSLIKCGKYWKDGQYGDITLQLLSQVGLDDERPRSQTQTGFFQAPTSKDAVRDSIIERVFQLTNKAQPHVPPRKIIHLQYLGWPDMDVPQSPGGLLTLVRHVNIATNEHVHPSMKAKQGPVLLHCSAGVGRTGGFLLVDSILAGIRHEMQRNGSPLGQYRSSSNSGSEEMDVDEPESVISSGKPLRSSPDDVSPRSSAPQSTSGSSLALTSDGAMSASLASSIQPPSEWSKRPITGSSIATESSPVIARGPRKISNLVAANLRKASNPNSRSSSSSKAQVAAWSKKLKTPSVGLRTTPPEPGAGPMSSSEELMTKGGVNYKLPRKLDEHRGSPPMPSSFSEPIREVLEDMREQRMSLCQSLRQYVFAHRAIISGTLELVDEAAVAKRLEAQVRNKRTTNGLPGTTAGNETPWSSTSSISSTSGPPSSPPTRILAGRFSPRERKDSPSSSATSSPPPPPKALTGKRSASPTGPNSGEAKLQKRPSLKRKHKTGDSQTDDFPRASATRQHVLPSSSGVRDR